MSSRFRRTQEQLAGKDEKDGMAAFFLNASASTGSDSDRVKTAPPKITPLFSSHCWLSILRMISLPTSMSSEECATERYDPLKRCNLFSAECDRLLQTEINLFQQEIDS